MAKSVKYLPAKHESVRSIPRVRSTPRDHTERPDAEHHMVIPKVRRQRWGFYCHILASYRKTVVSKPWQTEPEEQLPLASTHASIHTGIYTITYMSKHTYVYT